MSVLLPRFQSNWYSPFYVVAMSPIFQPTQDDNYLEKFTDQLKNHISQIFDDFNHNEIVLHHIEENNKNTTLILSETYRSDFLKKVKL